MFILDKSHEIKGHFRKSKPENIITDDEVMGYVLQTTVTQGNA